MSTTIGDRFAFPNDPESQSDPDYVGMTYRQWLIGMALQGILSNPFVSQEMCKFLKESGVDKKSFPRGIALAVINQADILLEEMKYNP